MKETKKRKRKKEREFSLLEGEGLRGRRKHYTNIPKVEWYMWIGSKRRKRGGEGAKLVTK